MSEVIFDAKHPLKSDPISQVSSPDSQASDPLSWEEAHSLLSGSSLRDFLQYCEKYRSGETEEFLDIFPDVSSRQMPPDIALRQIVQFVPGLGLLPGSEEGTEVEIFSEAVRAYIRQHVDRSVPLEAPGVR